MPGVLGPRPSHDNQNERQKQVQARQLQKDRPSRVPPPFAGEPGRPSRSVGCFSENSCVTTSAASVSTKEVIGGSARGEELSGGGFTRRRPRDTETILCKHSLRNILLTSYPSRWKQAGSGGGIGHERGMQRGKGDLREKLRPGPVYRGIRNIRITFSFTYVAPLDTNYRVTSPDFNTAGARTVFAPRTEVVNGRRKFSNRCIVYWQVSENRKTPPNILGRSSRRKMSHLPRTELSPSPRLLPTASVTIVNVYRDRSSGAWSA